MLALFSTTYNNSNDAVNDNAFNADQEPYCVYISKSPRTYNYTYIYIYIYISSTSTSTTYCAAAPLPSALTLEASGILCAVTTLDISEESPLPLVSFLSFIFLVPCFRFEAIDQRLQDGAYGEQRHRDPFQVRIGVHARPGTDRCEGRRDRNTRRPPVSQIEGLAIKEPVRLQVGRWWE